MNNTGNNDENNAQTGDASVVTPVKASGAETDTKISVEVEKKGNEWCVDPTKVTSSFEGGKRRSKKGGKSKKAKNSKKRVTHRKKNSRKH